MKIIIASKDRTADFASELKAAADVRVDDPLHTPLPWTLNALSLRDAKNEQEFLERWSALIRRKSHVDLLRFHISRKPGFVGGLALRLREAFWRVLRYQHERVIERQNIVNSQLTAALEFQLDEIRRLRARVDELERRGGPK